MELSEKINYLLRTNGLSQQELAIRMGISKQLINSLCTGKIRTSKSLYKIAKFFRVEYEWFFKPDDNAATPQANLNKDILILDRFHKIPFIATTLINKDNLKNGHMSLDGRYTEYELTNDTEYESLFCLSSTNNSLKFTFGDNSTLIFHTKLAPRNGDFIIVYLPDKDLFVYRYLRIKNGVKILIPTDEDIYKPLKMRDIDILVAVLYETRVKRKSES